MHPSNDVEKTRSPATPSSGQGPDLGETVIADQHGTVEGYVLEAGAKDLNENAKLASDGHTVLVPQPSDDPNDPLNWTKFKKHVILLIVSACAFLADYGSATGAVALLTQSKAYGVSQDTLNHATSIGVAMIGAGAPIAVGLSAYFGRLPVLFWFMVVALASAAGNAGASEYKGFFATRLINGFFATVAQGGGLMFINDMFYLHELARKINIWQWAILSSPYVGPLFAAFMITELAWYWPFIIYTIMTAICLALVIIFVEETYYNRKIPEVHQPPRGSRLLRLIGVQQRRNRQPANTFLEAMMRPVKAITKPVIFLTNVYYLFTFAWSVGINTTIAQLVTPLYGWGPRQLGFLCFTPIVGTVLGLVAGHWIHDFAARQYTRKHNDRLDPEAYLLVVWVAEPFLLAGLILIGFALDRGYHYMITALAWGLFSFGIMICTVGINAYNLIAYPEASGEVAGWITFSRATGGFIISYFQVAWAAEMGPAKSFAVQAGICAAAFLIIVALQIFGKRLRMWSGPLHFKTD